MWVCGSPQKGQRVTAASFPLERPPNAFTPAPGPRVHSRQSARVQVGDGERGKEMTESENEREREREWKGRRRRRVWCWCFKKGGVGAGERGRGRRLQREWVKESKWKREREAHTHPCSLRISKQAEPHCVQLVHGTREPCVYALLFPSADHSGKTTRDTTSVFALQIKPLVHEHTQNPRHRKNLDSDMLSQRSICSWLHLKPSACGGEWRKRIMFT